MKIIKKGDRRGAWKKQVICTGKGNDYDNAKKGNAPCGATLEITMRDIFMTSNTCYDLSTDYFYTIKCPCCGCLTDLPTNSLPSEVKEFASHRNEKTVDNDKLRFSNENNDVKSEKIDDDYDDEDEYLL